MGVTGLWRLIEPAGKPVPVETLENKVLAVDISIWLHQMVKGYQDAKGAPLPNAHLMGLFQRLCKLLYFRVKPVFVFDGGFPDLKRETIAKRQDSKLKYNSESERLKRELALILGKKTAVSSLLGKQISPKKNNPAVDNADDIFKLPELPEKEIESESEPEDETSSGSIVDLHSVDIESQNFKSLPAKEKYDLLIELKETRKMNSWGRLHELPKKSDNFSDFQMQRLLKRRKVQECLQETEKEIGDGGMSLNELESLLNEEGIDTKIESLPTRRIASNETTRFLLINNVKQALADAKKKKEAENNQNVSDEKQGKDANENSGKDNKDEVEEDLEKAIKMSLECVNEETDLNVSISKTDSSWTSFVTDSNSEYSSDSEEEDGYEPPAITSAKAYIMQYSDYTNKVIEKLVNIKKNTDKGKSKVPSVDQIIDELNNEKTIIADNIELSSSDDECKKNKHGNAEIIYNQSVVEISDENNSSSKDIEVSSGECNNIKLGTAETNDGQNQHVVEISEDVNSPRKFKEITQSSVICLETSAKETINLDTSTEDATVVPKVELQKSGPNTSDSDDDDLEEVPEVLNEGGKEVIQLTLKIGDAPVDDIFADIFKHNKSSEVSTRNVQEDFTDFTKNKEFCEEPVPSTSFANFESITSLSKKLEDDKNDMKKHSISGEMPNFEPNLKVNSSDHGIYDLPSTSKSSLIDNGNVMGAKDIKTYQETISVEASKPPSEIPEISNNKKKDIIVEKVTKEPASTETLNAIAEGLQNEEQNLLQEKGRLDRIGRNITEQMTKEAQELLQIFGIPYIIAPMEAEAQCAFLESVNLTDGTITDDSDIWLFGGRTVYKNFFNQKKHVLQFLSERIERSFNLTREQLILLALLVGSDYTTGVAGVGPVTALEILASFPFNKKQFVKETSKQDRYNQILVGLQEFKKWVRAGKRTDNVTLKKKLKNVDLTEDFPSMRVVQAYLEPNVEKSEDKFTWGEMDITVLRDYTKTKFGWSQHKLDEIIKPVIKRLTDRKSQRSVQDYFKRKIEFQSLEDQMSKRVKAAVQRMDPNAPIDQQIATSEQPKSFKTGRKRKTNKDTTVGTDDTGPSQIKNNKLSEETVLNDHSVKVVSQTNDGKSNIEIQIPKSDRVQEFIPQREKDKLNLLQNKLKAIEVFRKTKLDKKKKTTKRRAILPKEKAELSESSDSN